MEKGEYAQYSLHDIEEGHDVRVVLEVPKHVILQIYQDDIRLGQAELFQSNGVTETSVYGLRASSRSTIRIEVQEGMAEFIRFRQDNIKIMDKQLVVEWRKCYNMKQKS